MAILVALVTNYVTENPPHWAQNGPVVWSVFVLLAAGSLCLLLLERRLTGAQGGAAPVADLRDLRNVAASGGHSVNPPAVPAPVRGRDRELERIERLVRGPGGGLVVVCGAGGLGKTTVAAEAAVRARAEGRAVVWIRWRDDPTQLAQDLTHAAHVMGMPERRLEEVRTGRASLVDAVWQHLASVSGWLIVIDDVDVPSRVGPGPEPVAGYRGWLRAEGAGVLLVTSRDTAPRTWGPEAVLMRLEPLADEVGGAVLLDASPRSGTRAQAEALAARLGGLPLALNAAGGYLSVPTSRHRTFAAYQQALDVEFGELIGAAHPGAAGDPEIARQVVRHTWDLSLDQLHQDGWTLARVVLQLLALLEAAPIPRSLITSALLAGATGTAVTEAEVDGTLASLHRYGLLGTPPDAPGGAYPSSPGRLLLHPLVREVIAHTVTRPDPAGQWLAALDQHLTRAVDDTRSAPGRAGWPGARLLAPHLPAFLDRATAPDFETASRTLTGLADTLGDAGATAEELLLRRHVLDAATLRLGDHHHDALAARNNLANTLDRFGEHEQAARLHRQLLTVYERTGGPDHPDALASRNNLAVALDSLGEHQPAAALLRQALEGHERVLGPDHPQTLGNRNNLAVALDSLGEHGQAAELHRRTLEDRERVLGPDHPQTLASRDNLAAALNGLEEYGQAAELHSRTLEDRERVLGPDHPHTLGSRYNVAVALDNLGEHGQAADLHRRTLEDRERILGPDHPETAGSRHHLADSLTSAGEYRQSVDLLRRALADRERILGPDHPDTLTSRHDLANVLFLLGEDQEAAELHRRALADRERILGPDHPRTVAGRHNLAMVEAALAGTPWWRRRPPWRR
ncbi:FxSxx-COOH system tetratricopeptide repeat protein [Streptomyces xanthophaeus]|uniref:FxSxx-COOH system tetratricopeptide repeat protein n=1 Tax=Streptomyces xanthophaeus TaxID=67385 RepID=UPI003443538C